MRNQNIVRDMVERRGATPAVTVLPPAPYALVGRRGHRRMHDALRTSCGSVDVTELNLRVDGFSVVVRFLPDGVSTKREPWQVAAAAQSLLLSARETVIRGSHQPPAFHSPRAAPAAVKTVLDAESAIVPQ